MPEAGASGLRYPAGLTPARIWVPILPCMASQMKTTLDISDPLFREAKAVARREGVTVRAIVERGLQLALAERRRRKAFRLRSAAVGGKGLQPGAAGLTPLQRIELGYGD